MFAFERFIAMRYLKSKRKEVFISIITIISILSVAISVVVLDLTLAVMTGLETEIRAKLVDANAHLVVQRLGGDFEATSELLDKIRAVDGVVAASPYTYSQAMLSTENGARGLLIRGVADDSFARGKIAKVLHSISIDDLFKPVKVFITRPDGIEDEIEMPGIIVGKTLRDRLGLMPNIPVSIFSPQFLSSPQGLIPRMRRFMPIGYYSSGLIEYENGLAYMSIKDAQAFFGMGNNVSGIEVAVSDLFRSREIAKKIVDTITNEQGTYYATDWTEQNKPLWDAMRLEKRVYFIVLLLLILVASFSIVSTLVMVVMEKSRDIAVMKAIGAKDRVVLWIFLIQGALIGLGGIILGSVFGYIGCIALREYGFKLDERVFSLDRVPVHIIPSNFVLVAVSAFLITAAAGIYPAWRAARLKPAESLRYE